MLSLHDALVRGRFVDSPGETMSRPVRLLRNALVVACVGMAVMGCLTLIG